MSAGERKKGACGMVYLAITAAIFTLDFFLKKYIDKKYARKVCACGGRYHCAERYDGQACRGDPSGT